MYCIESFVLVARAPNEELFVLDEDSLLVREKNSIREKPNPFSNRLVYATPRPIRVSYDTTHNDFLEKMYRITRFYRQRFRMKIICRYPSCIEFITAPINDVESIDIVFDVARARQPEFNGTVSRKRARIAEMPRGRPPANKTEAGIAEMHRGRLRANKTDCNCDANTKPKQKRSRSDTAAKASFGQKMPRQAATCSDFKEKSICLSEKAYVVENKRDDVVEEEIAARA
ncbi:hypothetical protein Q3G72_018163 [Acer saccharum]|nr:hypothetical protein Q3G72_018163 [Acer saccharum]